jgi:hypothetical protein
MGLIFVPTRTDPATDPAKPFTVLIRGNVLPSVTTTQILLRRHKPHSSITADGIYGPRTKAAVQSFQSLHKLVKDGIVGNNTWNALTKVSGYQTIDVVDCSDPSLRQHEMADIRSAGGDPIVVYGNIDTIGFLAQKILSRGKRSNIMLLRFHGHGGHGTQNITGTTINGSPHMASISIHSFAKTARILAPIRNLMLPFGSVQLLGCDVGGGRGSALILLLAQLWGVPVTAGLYTQLGGGSDTFRFEGPTVSAFPEGDLKSWSTAMQVRFGTQNMMT